MIFDIGGAMYGLGNLAGLVRDGSVPGAVAAYLSASAGETDTHTHTHTHTHAHTFTHARVWLERAHLLCGTAGHVPMTCVACVCVYACAYVCVCTGTALGAVTGTTPLIIAAESAVRTHTHTHTYIYIYAGRHAAATDAP